MKTKLHKTFGATRPSLEVARRELEQVLQVEFVPHESLYFGGDYFRFELGDCALVLRTNFLDDDGELLERSFPEEKMLLYIDTGSENSVALAILEKLAHAAAAFPLLRDNSK